MTETTTPGPRVLRPGEGAPHEGVPVKALMFGLPIYGQVTMGFHAAMVATTVRLIREGITFGNLYAGNDSLVQRARNNIVAEFMATDASHLMFIDSDIEWEPDAILRLLAAGKDLVVGAYPRKTDTPSMVFLPRVDEQGRCEKDEATGLVRIAAGATGFMMIRRRVIEVMMASYPQLRYRAYDSDGISEAARAYTFSLFDTITTAEAFYSEDYAFCFRFEAIGGSCWVDPAIRLTHHGAKAYKVDPGLMFRPLPAEAAP